MRGAGEWAVVVVGACGRVARLATATRLRAGRGAGAGVGGLHSPLVKQVEDGGWENARAGLLYTEAALAIPTVV